MTPSAGPSPALVLAGLFALALALTTAACGGPDFTGGASTYVSEAGGDEADNTPIIICSPCPPDGTGDATVEAGAGVDATLEADSDASPADGARADAGEASVLDAAGEANAPACVPGGSCSPNECQSGTWVCGDAGRVCQELAAVDAGTPCGALGGDGGARVCIDGQCVACNAGGDCSDPGEPCLEKSYDCSSGTAQCTAVTSVADGTPCGDAGLYCNGGVCSACRVGASCPPAGNACHTGKVTACSAAGVASCTDQGAAAAAGTSCAASGGASGVCDGAGSCAACSVGSQCNPGGNVCQVGVQACASGPACTGATSVREGQTCGDGEICHGGACIACDAASCAAGCCDSSGCVTTGQSTLECGTGGTACATCQATNKCLQAIACVSGVCAGSNPVTCSSPAQCKTAGTCNPGTGTCVYPNATDGTACNADGNACTAPDTCVGGACTAGPMVSCVPEDGCHLPGTCAPTTGMCSASPPAPSTTACFTAVHATGALCDGLGNCQAVTCANGFVNDQGTCKVPNCAGAACGGPDGAGGLCTGANGICSQPGQHCNDAGQCVCDGTSCTGCCTTDGQCIVAVSPTDACGSNGSACQTCNIRDHACYAGSCKLVMTATGCVTDADCVPGGCLNGVCLGTIGIAGAVSCRDSALQCFNGCSYPSGPAPVAAPICGNTNGADLITCDAPDDCAAGQDCCWVFTPGLQLTQTCYQQSAPGVVGSGCPVSNQSNELDVGLVCDPRSPVCPSGGPCLVGSGVFSCD
jgi:hypothetical protein